MEDQPARPADPPAAPETQPAPESAPVATVAELPAEAPAETPAEAEATAEPAPRRPRGRTALLMASAALLGVVAGVATGYTVQAERAPTPLPPLSQAKLSYPDKPVPADEWEPVPAKHDRRVKTDGDLRKLLVKKPKGAQESPFYSIEDRWMTVDAYARSFESPGYMFRSLLGSDVRRVAATAWDSDQFKSTIVRLVQFQEGTAREAPLFTVDQQLYMPTEAGNDGHLIAGSAEGRYWVDESPHTEPGYLPLHSARAVACRGDIVMDIHITDTEPISEKEIRELTERSGRERARGRRAAVGAPLNPPLPGGRGFRTLQG